MEAVPQTVPVVVDKGALQTADRFNGQHRDVVEEALRGDMVEEPVDERELAEQDDAQVESGELEDRVGLLDGLLRVGEDVEQDASEELGRQVKDARHVAFTDAPSEREGGKANEKEERERSVVGRAGSLGCVAKRA